MDKVQFRGVARAPNHDFEYLILKYEAQIKAPTEQPSFPTLPPSFALQFPRPATRRHLPRSPDIHLHILVIVAMPPIDIKLSPRPAQGAAPPESDGDQYYSHDDDESGAENGGPPRKRPRRPMSVS